MFKPDEITGTGLDLRDATRVNNSAWERLHNEEEEQEEDGEHELDSEENEAMLRMLLARYETELDRQSDNRLEMAEDEDYYDNIQWSDTDAAVLKERGQVPLVYNVISSSINWVLGTEKNGRTDFRILPRRKDAGKPAERKTQLLKYLSDVNNTPFHFSRAFEDCVKVGIGWVEDGVQDDDDGEPIYSRYESWRNLLWDSACTEKDLTDARYVYRSKWVDLDVAISMFPDRVAQLKASAGDFHNYGIDTQGDEPMDSAEDQRANVHSSRANLSEFNRERVRLIECWYRIPKQVKRMSGGDFAGEVVDENNMAPGHQQDIDAGNAVVVERTMMRMHVAIFSANAMLYLGESPYRHNQYPFTPLWCYRRGKDGMPYGMIRGMKDIQQDINKRASKALHILSTNKVIMDKGAVDDLQVFIEEIARPDAVIEKNSGKEIIINAERELAPAHLDLMSRSIQMVQMQSGVTDENMGRQTNATSGKAIGLRQQQGSMATAGIFDNLRFAKQIQGAKQLSLMEQYFDEPKSFRITNMRGTPEYITINDGLPENDIVHTKADFIISESDWRASVRQAQTQELLDLLGQLAPVAPQLALVMLDLIIESMDIPNRDELVKRIRQQTGMRDPDAEELTPEEKLAEQQKQQAQQAQAELQQRDAVATIAGKEAKAMRDQSAAQKDQATVQKMGIEAALQGVQVQMSALQAAVAALTTPQAVPVADTILHEAGYQSRSEHELIAQQQQQQEAEQQAAAEQEQQAAMEQEAQMQAEQQQADPQQGMPQQPQQ